MKTLLISLAKIFKKKNVKLCEHCNEREIFDYTPQSMNGQRKCGNCLDLGSCHM